MSDLQMTGQILTDADGEHYHEFPVQVYWEDTDAGGIVYYANYLKFTERARTDLLRGLGVHQQKLMVEDGLNFVVRDCSLEYLKPARLDDILIVKTSIHDLKAATLRMQQNIYCDELLLVKSIVRVACLQKNGRPARFSPQIKDKFTSIVYASGDMKD